MAPRTPHQLVLLACCLAFVGVTGTSGVAHARRAGLVVTDCSGCHGGKAEIQIALSFEPEAPSPGESVLLTLEVTSPNMRSLGFYLQTDEYSAFRSVSGEPTSTSSDGVTHRSPITASSGRARVQMHWTAPQHAAGTLFHAVVVAADGDGRNTGDAAAHAAFPLVWGCEGVPVYADLDGDGFGAEDFGAKFDCGPSPGWALEPGDCREFDPKTYPGAEEICNGRDDDCDGEIDEGAPPRWVYLDRDGDGFGVESDRTHQACELPVGFADNADDCNDFDAEAHPFGVEVCNGIDDDCNGETDELPKERCGVGWCERLSASCSLACVPGIPTPEWCNGIDDDCDGEVDEDAICPEGQLCHLYRCRDREEAEALAELPDQGASIVPMPPLDPQTPSGASSGAAPPESPPSNPTSKPSSGSDATNAPALTPEVPETTDEPDQAPRPASGTTGDAATSKSGCALTRAELPSTRDARLPGAFLCGIALLAGARRRRTQVVQRSSAT